MVNLADCRFFWVRDLEFSPMSEAEALSQLPPLAEWRVGFPVENLLAITVAPAHRNRVGWVQIEFPTAQAQLQFLREGLGKHATNNSDL